MVFSRLRWLAGLWILILAGGPGFAQAEREVFVDARPRRQAPLWYDNLPAWKQAHALPDGMWLIGVASRALSEEAARRAALANARALCGLPEEPGAKAQLVEEDSYLRVFGPDPQTPKWYYLAVLYRAPAQPPSAAQAYEQAIQLGRQAMNEKRLLEARAYFLAAESLRRGREDLPPVVELRAVEDDLKSYEDLLRVAEQAARRRAGDEAIAAFDKVAARARELHMESAAAYAQMRIEELKKGEFDRWIVLTYEVITYRPEGMEQAKAEPAGRLRAALESFLAARRVSVVSLDAARPDENASSAEVLRWARERNASTLLLARARAEFRTWTPAQPYSEVRLPTAKGQGTVELIDLRSGEVAWKQYLEASGFGQATEQEACEDALANLAKRAVVLLERDATKLGF